MRDLLDRLSAIKILVVGDLILDHYIWGDVNRISPEAPVPIVHATNDSWAAGGAANVALNLSGLGVQTAIAGHVGKDEAGDRLCGILGDNQVNFLKTDANQKNTAPTIVKTRVMARSQQLCRIDREAPPEVYSRAFGISDTWLRQFVTDYHAVILSDYAKGTINQPLIDRLTKLCGNSNVLLAMDPKPSRKLDVSGMGLLTPNRSEAYEMVGLSSSLAGDSIEKVCKAIHETHQPQRLVITLGADGMAVSANGGVEQILPTEAKEVFDVSGAGDTVIAALTASISAGESTFNAARFANRAAGIVVGHMGTVPITREELEAC